MDFIAFMFLIRCLLFQWNMKGTAYYRLSKLLRNHSQHDTPKAKSNLLSKFTLLSLCVMEPHIKKKEEEEGGKEETHKKEQ